jgi:hypothetical protein
MSTATQPQELHSRGYRMSTELLERVRIASVEDHRSVNAEFIELVERGLEARERERQLKERRQRIAG